MTTYADSGVDVDTEAKASRLMYEAARQTWTQRQGDLGEVIVPFDDFSGLRAINVGALPTGTVMNLGFDGVGTKAEIAQRVGDHSTIAHDLIAMVADDAVIRGAEPVVMGSILDTNGLDVAAIEQLSAGYLEAAKLANVAIINGEIAQLGDAVGGYGNFRYNWGAALVWFAHQDRLLTGQAVQAGDHLVGLSESGFRSNGLSLVRKALGDKYGDDWHKQSFEDSTLGREVLRPSLIYTPAILDMTGGWSLEREAKATVHGVAHITGGGLPEKLGRMLKPSGLGAEITDAFTPNSLMLHCQEIAGISDREAYNTWNMGQGMVIATPDAETVANIAARHGFEAKIIGKVTSSPDINIASKGQKSEILEFTAKI